MNKEELVIGNRVRVNLGNKCVGVGTFIGTTLCSGIEYFAIDSISPVIAGWYKAEDLLGKVGA